MEVRCPGCKRRFRVTEAVKDGLVACPKCRTAIPVQTNAGAPPRDLLTDILEEIRQIEALHPALAVAVASPGPTIEAPPESVKPEKPKREKKPRRHFSKRVSKAYARGPSPYRGQKIAVAVGIVIIALGGYAAVHFIRQGIRTQGVRLALRNANSQLAALQAELAKGDDLRKKEDFKGALETYRSVVSTATPLLARLRDASLGLKPGAIRNEAATTAKALSDLVARAKAASEDPAVKYPAQGLVDFDGQWVTPEDKKALFEAKMKAEGRQLYKGKWLTEAEIHAEKGEVEYKGRWVTKEELEELLKAEVAVKPPTPKPTPKPKPKPLDRTKFRPNAHEWVLDDFDTAGHIWSAVGWPNANPLVLTHVPEGGAGHLKISLPGGKQDKAAIFRPIRLDFSTRQRLRMDIVNNSGEPLRIAIALQTNTYYESRWMHLKTGLNKNVTFNLLSGDYKCAATRWSPAARITKLDSVSYLYLLFYNRTGELQLDNVKALGGG